MLPPRQANAGGIVITDLNSTAGSFVNGHRFDSAQRLTIGDRLQVGHLLLSIRRPFAL